MKPLPRLRLSLPLLAALLPIAVSQAGEGDTVRVSTREQLVAAIGRAEAGTTILLAPGTYRGGISADDLRGTRERPIIIRAEDPRRPPVIEGGGSGLHLSDPVYVELRDLVLRRAEGNGLNIDDGGSTDSPARHVTLVGLVVENIGPRGNRDGIKLSGIDDFRVENCTVTRWGDGGSAIDMVGCHKGTITGCTFRHRDAVQANGVQTKGGSSEIVIRRCRFEEAGGRAVNIGGSTGLAFFRPEPQGYEAKAITVEDCTFIGSAAPVCFVGVDGAVVRHNTIYRPTAWAIRILQETQERSFVPCRNGRFTNNVIVFRSDELRSIINIGPHTAPETFTFADNVWYCLDRPTATRDLIRLPVEETGATYGVDPRLRAPEEGDLRLGNPNVNAGVRETEIAQPPEN